MYCKKCGSRRISWEIDSGSVVQTYDENGKVIDTDFKCDSLNSPQCAECGSIDLGDGKNVLQKMW